MRSLVTLVLLAGCVSAPAPALRVEPIERAHDLSGHVVGTARSPMVAIVMASWCEHCRDELAEIDSLRGKYPHVRWIGINYKAHEEYDNRGNSVAIRQVADRTPWLEIVPADDQLFATLGS